MRTHSFLVLLLAAMVALSLLAACKSKTLPPLTLSKAAEVISRQFPIQVTINVATGPITPREGSMAHYFQTPEGRVRKLWQDDGLISLKWQNVVGHPLRAREPVALVELTKLGKSFYVGSPDSGIIRMCEQQFDRVTGVEMGKNNEVAKVAYAWKLGNLTPFGKRQNEVLGQAALCGNPEPQADSASLSLYADGWRIAQ